MISRGDTTPTVSGSRPTSLAGPRSKVLILGGTTEGRALARLLVDEGYRPVTSLAGVTRKPCEIPGETRIGGFGGADGLVQYLAAGQFFCIVDATHPFAAAISHQAKDAALRSGLPILRLERPAWQAQAGDRWTEVADIEAAAAAIPSGAHILLTIGRKEVAPFLARADISGIARMIEPLDKDTKVSANWRIMLERPPFHIEKELCLLSEHSISHLVTKNSGGEQTRAKLTAVRMKGIDVVMVERPTKPEVSTVADPQAALSFLLKL